MKNIKTHIKKLSCLFLCLVIVFSLSGCSSNKLTEENVTKTVDKFENALINLNIKDIKKYAKIDSIQNLDIRIDYSKIANKKKLYELGKAVFENLVIEVDSIDLEAKTVTVNVTNKSLYLSTTNLLSEIKQSNSLYGITQKLGDEEFIGTNVDKYLESIVDLPIYSTPKQVTFKIEQNKGNLVLVLDNDAIAAISGEASIAFKRQFILNSK